MPNDASPAVDAYDALLLTDPVPDAPVVLTGASDFIAKDIARRLLEEGYGVRATPRSPAREGRSAPPSSPASPKGRWTALPSPEPTSFPTKAG